MNMRTKHKILLPIIIDRPEFGRIHHKFYSLKSFYGFFLIMFVIILFIAFLDDKEVFFFMLTDLIGFSMFIIIPYPKMSCSEQYSSFYNIKIRTICPYWKRYTFSLSTSLHLLCNKCCIQTARERVTWEKTN